LQGIGALALTLMNGLPATPSNAAARNAGRAPRRYLRPSDPDWPGLQAWTALNLNVGGQLLQLESPFDRCKRDPAGAACNALFKALPNPYFIGDDPALTQTLGLVDGWISRPSAYAIAVLTAQQVASAVNFARGNNLRLVVKGGGHSYLGTSSSADSLLIWTRRMDGIELHDDFVATGCKVKPQPAVSIGAGAMWMHVYEAVMTRAGRYVQGGGCGTVGVAGLVQSGGFGSSSKGFGTAASNLLEAEVVTADGEIRIANECTNPELFWALKGGGGGSFGVVTRLTLRTHELPAFIGAVFVEIKARSDDAFRRLIGEVLGFYQDHLMNPHWGEQISFSDDNVVGIKMVFQGLDQEQAEAVWQPFLARLAAMTDDYEPGKPFIAAMPGRSFWDPAFWKRFPDLMKFDNRSGASPANMYWAGDEGQAGQVLAGYHSAWLPARLLAVGKDRQKLVDAIFEAAHTWFIALHFNKGLAGSTPEALAATRDTAMNPAVLDAFALAIIAGELPPSYPGIAGHEPDIDKGRRSAGHIRDAFAAIRKLAPDLGSYVSESDFFETDWKRAYWGANVARLERVKQRYDPDGLFHVHHGIGSDRWSEDGFTEVVR
jgi:FAD/FMN-containing dehydrogenase